MAIVGRRSRVLGAYAAAVASLLWSAAVHAAPVAVRVRECAAHGFVDFFDGDTRIANGELIQFRRGQGRLENRLTIAFEDGSLHEETLTFSQKRFFRLHTYHLVQRGPSFPESVDVSFDDTGRYQARVTKPGREEETHDGHVDVPADVYNGLASTLLKNLAPGETAAVHTLAFTPKPRLLEVPRGVPRRGPRRRRRQADRQGSARRLLLDGRWTGPDVRPLRGPAGRRGVGLARRARGATLDALTSWPAISSRGSTRRAALTGSPRLS